MIFFSWKGEQGGLYAAGQVDGLSQGPVCAAHKAMFAVLTGVFF